MIDVTVIRCPKVNTDTAIAMEMKFHEVVFKCEIVTNTTFPTTVDHP